MPGGSCPSVGVAGLALGGGHGLAGRRWGLVTDNIRALTIVTADGRIRQVTADSDEDLFWASQGGGGGNFGIVASLTMQTHRTRGAAYFFISFPWSQASQVLAAWQAFAPTRRRRSPRSARLAPARAAGGERARSVLRLAGEAATADPAARAHQRRARERGGASYISLMLRWAGCLQEGFRACHTVGTFPGGTMPRTSFYAKSDYFDKALSPRRGRR